MIASSRLQEPRNVFFYLDQGFVLATLDITLFGDIQIFISDSFVKNKDKIN